MNRRDFIGLCPAFLAGLACGQMPGIYHWDKADLGIPIVCSDNLDKHLCLKLILNSRLKTQVTMQLDGVPMTLTDIKEGSDYYEWSSEATNPPNLKPILTLHLPEGKFATHSLVLSLSPDLLTTTCRLSFDRKIREYIRFGHS